MTEMKTCEEEVVVQAGNETMAKVNSASNVIESTTTLLSFSDATLMDEVKTELPTDVEISDSILIQSNASGHSLLSFENGSRFGFGIAAGSAMSTTAGVNSVTSKKGLRNAAGWLKQVPLITLKFDIVFDKKLCFF